MCIAGRGVIEERVANVVAGTIENGVAKVVTWSPRPLGA